MLSSFPTHTHTLCLILPGGHLSSEGAWSDEEESQTANCFSVNTGQSNCTYLL